MSRPYIARPATTIFVSIEFWGRSPVSHVRIEYDDMENRAAELRSRVGNMVTQSFAAAPAAAKAVAGANRTYMSSLAMMANFAQIALAVKKLFDRTDEHANLMQSTSQQVQQADVQRAARSFDANTIMPTYRTTGSSNV